MENNPLHVDPRLESKRRGKGLWVRLPPALEGEVRALAKREDIRLSDAMIRLMVAGLDAAGKR